MDRIVQLEPDFLNPAHGEAGHVHDDSCGHDHGHDHHDHDHAHGDHDHGHDHDHSGNVAATYDDDIKGVSLRLDRAMDGDKVTAWLNRHAPARCIFDLSKLEMLDSSGVGSIVTCLHKVKKLDGNLCLAAAHGKVATVIAITRLDLVFKIYPSVEAALQALAAPTA